MKSTIQFVHMPTSETMERYALERLEKLNKKYDWLVSADVFFKKENDPKGRGSICDIELSLPGPKIFASSHEKNYELAFKKTLSDVEKQLKKRKAEMKPYH